MCLIFVSVCISVLNPVQNIIPYPNLHTLQPKTLNNTVFAERDLLFFNRVPKVGSEHMIELIRLLGVVNNFQARAGFTEPIFYHLTEAAQKEFAQKLYAMGESQAYSQHINYIDFRAYQLPQPIYINLIRDPVERVISWFYYKRAPWTVVQRFNVTNQFQSIAFYKKDYGECVLKKDPECFFPQNAKFADIRTSHTRQSLFLCGHDPACEPFNSQQTLQRSKHIVETNYAVVGSLEDVNVTLTVLENYIPKYFRGVTKLYYDNKSGLSRDKRNGNTWKPAVPEEIKNILRQNFTREYEFYYFCKQRLYKQYYALQNLK